jgi:signal transduction histidine kinase
MGMAQRISNRVDLYDKTPLTPEILVPRLGYVLVEKGLITQEQLQLSLDRQTELRLQGFPMPFGTILVDMGFLDRAALDAAVTEQIMALRAALQDANYNLERRVEERTAELQEAMQRLSELNQLKANFVSNITHELRTPLTHIKGYLDLMIAQDLGPITLEQQQALQVIRRSSDRLERLIEDLIMFSTAERGEITIRLENFNLVNLTRAIVERAQPKARAKNISIQLEKPEEEIGVEGDKEKIAWVMMQLLDNAIKFTPNGKPVGIKLEPEGKVVWVSVFDAGIGIPPERLDEIFEPFHQLDGASTRHFGGTGLGLALVHRIIKAHGSIIKVSSQVGVGSNFKFVLKHVTN